MRMLELAGRPDRYLPARNADGDHARQDEVQVIVGRRFLYDARTRLERRHLDTAGDCPCNGGIPACEWLNLQRLNQVDVSVRPAESLEHTRQFRPSGLVPDPDDLTKAGGDGVLRASENAGIVQGRKVG